MEQRIEAWKAEHWGEIRRAMPRDGGVLLVAYITRETKLGVGQLGWRKLKHVAIASTGGNEEEARASLSKSWVTTADPGRPTQNDPSEPLDFYETNAVFRWIKNPVGHISSAAGPKLQGTLEAGEIAGILTVLADYVRAEQKRLDAEWIGIENQDQRLNSLHRELKQVRTQGLPESPQDLETAVRRFEVREESKYKARREARRTRNQEEQTAIEEDRDDINSAVHALQARRQELAGKMGRWRCPAGVTVDQCRNHREQCNQHLLENDKERGEIIRLSNALEQRRRALAFRLQAIESALDEQPELEDAGRRSLEAKIDDFRNEAETFVNDLRHLEQGRAEYRDRISKFRKYSLKLRELRSLVERTNRSMAGVKALSPP